jgi:RNA methyltransferase, TrmH family
MKQLTINARSNPWVQQWLRWQSKASERKAAGAVWLEGEHLVAEALQRAAASHRFTVQQLVLPDTAESRDLLQKLLEKQLDNAANTVASVVWLNPSVYAQLCSLNSSPSVCAEVRLLDSTQVNFQQPAVVLDGLQDPGNVGTVLRLCAAFGINQVLLSQGCASAWGSKALRAGQGAQLAVNIIEDANLAQVYAGFASAGVPIAATSLAAGSKALGQFSNNEMRRAMVWVFGHEGQGISAQTQAAASHLVHIPMQGGFESLNVASAAAICLWQWSQAQT